MAATKIWTVYQVGSSKPLREIEAQFEGTALDHTAAIHGVKRDRLYAIPRGIKSKGKRPSYVMLSWADPDRGYQEAGYPESEVPALLDRLRSRGVATVLINDREVTL